jgi:hypothetical protein
LGGCFCWVFWRNLRRAALDRTLRALVILLIAFAFLHGARSMK